MVTIIYNILALKVAQIIVVIFIIFTQCFHGKIGTNFTAKKENFTRGTEVQKQSGLATARHLKLSNYF